MIIEGIKIEKIISESVSERTKRKGKRIYVARLIYLDQTGKRREITREARLEKDAKDKLKDLKRTYQELGISAFNAEKATILKLIDRFEADSVKPAVYDGKGRKISGYKSINPIKTYLKILRKHFPVKELKNLTYNDLKMFRDKRLSTISSHTGAHLSVTEVNRELQQMRRVLNFAVENRWLGRNPFEDGKALIQNKIENKRQRLLSEEDEARLLAQCVGEREHLRAILICAFDTGFRKGEILSLEWRDVVLEQSQFGTHILRNGYLRIRPELAKNGEERFSAISDRLAVDLRMLKEKALREFGGAESIEKNLLFGIKDFKRAFSTACRLAGIIDFHFHDSRHVLTTRLARGGMSELEARKITGHKDATIFERYHNVDFISLVRQQQVLEKYSDNFAETAYPTDIVQ